MTTHWERPLTVFHWGRLKSWSMQWLSMKATMAYAEDESTSACFD